MLRCPEPSLGFPMEVMATQTVKRLPTMREIRVQSLGREDLLEKKMATHSSILAWKIPWTVEPGSLRSWGRKESDTTEQLHFNYVGHMKLNSMKLFSSLLPFFPPEIGLIPPRSKSQPSNHNPGLSGIAGHPIMNHLFSINCQDTTVYNKHSYHSKGFRGSCLCLFKFKLHTCLRWVQLDNSAFTIFFHCVSYPLSFSRNRSI